MRTVDVIFRRKAAILVEYMEGDIPIRVSLPVEKVHIGEDGKRAQVSDAVLKTGIPYGVPWGMHVDKAHVEFTSEAIENELHKAGIWTISDYQRSPGAVQGAILSLTANVVRSILQVVKEYSSKEV